MMGIKLIAPVPIWLLLKDTTDLNEGLKRNELSVVVFVVKVKRWISDNLGGAHALGTHGMAIHKWHYYYYYHHTTEINYFWVTWQLNDI